jgi:hypothetical protein
MSFFADVNYNYIDKRITGRGQLGVDEGRRGSVRVANRRK